MVSWIRNSPAEPGFKEKLKELHPDVKFRYFNAQISKSRLANFLRSTDLSSVDLIYTSGTNTTILVQQYNRGRKPHVFSIVSTPVLSGVVNSFSRPGKNVTGAALMFSIERQLDLMLKMKKMKKLAVWFDPREKQSTGLLDKIEKHTRKLGIKQQSYRIIPDESKYDKLLERASKETNQLDGLLLIGSFSFHYHSKKILSKLSPSLFTMTNAKRFVQTGATAAIAPSFRERGETAAKLAHRILSGEAAGEIPVSLVTNRNAILYINKPRADSVGLNGYEKLGYHVKMVQEEK